MQALVGSKSSMLARGRCSGWTRPAGRVSCSRRQVTVYNKLLLKPTGSGQSDHIGQDPIELPGEIELKNGKFEVGRHALIEIDGSNVTVTDLSSTNGTWIDEKELTPNQAVPLKVGSEVIFGDEYLAKYALAEELDAPVPEKKEEPEPEKKDEEALA